MLQPTGSIHEVRWSELCPWLILAKAWRVSLFFRVLLYATLGLILTQWGWAICENLAGNNPHLLERLTPSSIVEQPNPAAPTDVELRFAENSLIQAGPPGGTFGLDTPANKTWWDLHWRSDASGPLVKSWAWLSSPIYLIFEQPVTFLAVFYKLLCGLWAIAVWAVFGGAIARTAARYLTKEEVIGPIAAGRAAITKWPSTVGAPCIVLLLAAVLTLPLAILGLLMRADFLAVFGGLFWILALVWGICLAIVLVGLWFGWPLMWATIAVERSDAFDAASRTASYVYQRPLRFAFYVVVASVLGIAGHMIVLGFAAAGDHLTDWAVSWGSGTERIAQLTLPPAGDVSPTLEGSAAVAARSIRFWKHILLAVAASYPLAFLFSASVGIYLLLRLEIDSTEMDEIVLEAGEDAGRMPELDMHGGGVPEMTSREPDDLSTRRNISPDET